MTRKEWVLLVAARSTAASTSRDCCRSALVRHSHCDPHPSQMITSWQLTCARRAGVVRAMHRQFYCSSFEALRGSMLALKSECVLVAALAKQTAMVVPC